MLGHNLARLGNAYTAERLVMLTCGGRVAPKKPMTPTACTSRALDTRELVLLLHIPLQPSSAVYAHPSLTISSRSYSSAQECRLTAIISSTQVPSVGRNHDHEPSEPGTMNANY